MVNALERLWAWISQVGPPIEMLDPDQRQAALAANATEALAAVRALRHRVVKLEQLAGILGPDGWAVEKISPEAVAKAVQTIKDFPSPHACGNSMCFGKTYGQYCDACRNGLGMYISTLPLEPMKPGTGFFAGR